MSENSKKEVDMVGQGIYTVNTFRAPIEQDAEVRFDVSSSQVAFFVNPIHKTQILIGASTNVLRPTACLMNFCIIPELRKHAYLRFQLNKWSKELHNQILCTGTKESINVIGVIILIGQCGNLKVYVWLGDIKTSTKTSHWVQTLLTDEFKGHFR